MLAVRGSPGVERVAAVMMEEVLLRAGGPRGRPSKEWESVQLKMWQDGFGPRPPRERPQPPCFTVMLHPFLSFEDLGRVTLLQVSARIMRFEWVSGMIVGWRMILVDYIISLGSVC